jgi:hypothetical protein
VGLVLLSIRHGRDIRVGFLENRYAQFVKDDGAMAPFSDMAAGILDFGSVPWSVIDISGFLAAPFENFKGCTQG